MSSDQRFSQTFIQVLDASSIESIRAYELSQLEKQIPDSFEREMASWNAPWRQESLEHYLKTGWSVGLWDDDSKRNFNGYFLGQMFLFYKGLTQVLWIEHVSADSQAGYDFLRTTAIQYAKDKHLQSVFFAATGEEVKTTKRD